MRCTLFKNAIRLGTWSPLACIGIIGSQVAIAQPYDFAAAEALLQQERQNLRNHVAVIVEQNGVEIFRSQFGDIGYDTKTRLASFTKTLSAAVVLATVDERRLFLNEEIGRALPQFEVNGIGDASVIQCFGMTHGIETTAGYEIDRRYTLAQSVTLIGANGTLAFAPGSELDYEGSGMQVVGRIVEIRTGQTWEQVARSRIFDKCSMPQADYGQFAPNPAIAGGARASANENINFARMILNRGWFGGQRVLSDNSIDQLFTNPTFALPVRYSPFPQSHPEYPYGVDPDYGFGGWVLAQNPDSGFVEEVVGAGAWGSYMWLDRRRGLSAVLITDVPPGTQSSIDAALGLFSIAREEVDALQVSGLNAQPSNLETRLTWSRPAGALNVKVYGAASPIRDVFRLREATLLLESTATEALVPAFPFYAVTAVYPQLENTALIPGGNSLSEPAPCPSDLNGDGAVDGEDVIVFFSAWDSGSAQADINGDEGVDGDDVIAFFRLWDAGC